MFHRAGRLADLETIFLERYGALLRRALHLTDRDRQRAEDLVHDAFVEFALSQPNLEPVRDLDGYLYRRQVLVPSIKSADRARCSSR
jgi:DNA-directed RNA polymerase specialized sigma24 family protein